MKSKKRCARVINKKIHNFMDCKCSQGQLNFAFLMRHSLLLFVHSTYFYTSQPSAAVGLHVSVCNYTAFALLLAPKMSHAVQFAANITFGRLTQLYFVPSHLVICQQFSLKGHFMFLSSCLFLIYFFGLVILSSRNVRSNLKDLMFF